MILTTGFIWLTGLSNAMGHTQPSPQFTGDGSGIFADDEIIYLDPLGYIHILDTNQAHEVAVDWSSPEGGYIDFAVGDFNDDSDMEIVAVKGIGASGDGFVIYDPVVNSNDIAIDGRTANGVPWAILYRDIGSFTLVEAGNFDTAIPGDEILHIVDDGVSNSSLTILISDMVTPTGESWGHQMSTSHQRLWDQAIVGEIDGAVTGADEVILIRSDFESDTPESVMAVYRVDDGGFTSNIPIWENISGQHRWLNAAIGDVIPGGHQELVVTRSNVTDNAGHGFIMQYSADVGLTDDDLIPYPYGVTDVILADINGQTNESSDKEIFFIKPEPTLGVPEFVMVNRGSDNPLNQDAHVMIPGPDPHSAASGDLNGDGKDELIVSCGDEICIHYQPYGDSEQFNGISGHSVKLIKAADVDRNGISLTPDANATPLPTSTPSGSATPTPTNTGVTPNIHPNGWDLNFGPNGQADTGCDGVLDFGTDNRKYSRVMVQSTGRLLVSVSCNYQWTIKGYHPNGTLDQSFGNGGTLTTDFNLVAIQADDKILAASGLRIARFNVNGSLDPSFDGDGIADTLATADIDDLFAHVVLLQEGKIAALGKIGQKRILAKFNSDGSLDAEFNATGLLTVAFDSLPNDFERCVYGSDMIAQPDGKLLVARCEYDMVDPFNQNFRPKVILERYNPDGTLDPSFGVAGLVEFPPEHARIFSIGVQSTGRIIASMIYNHFYTITAFQADGTLDTTFQPFDVVQDIYTLVIDANDRILFKDPMTAATHVVMRLQPSGALDTSFGNGGQIGVDGFATSILDFVQEPSGNFILDVAGRDSPDVFDQIRLVRYVENLDSPLPTPDPMATSTPTPIEYPTATPTVDPNGTPMPTPTATYTASPTVNPDWTPLATATTTPIGDSNPVVHPEGWSLSFGNNGQVDSGCQQQLDVVPSDEPGLYHQHTSQIVVQSTGRFLVSSSCNERWTLARYHPNGTLDVSFGYNGMIYTDFNLVTVQKDDKILAAYGLRIARFSADGFLDPSFGNEGVADALATTNPLDWFDHISLLDSGQIVALGKKERKRILARFGQDGQPDPTFNSIGVRIDELGELPTSYDGCVYGFDMATQPDGKILVARCTYTLVDQFNQRYEFTALVERYETNGQLDSSFGDGGQLAFQTIADAAVPTIYGLAVQSNGRVIISLAVNGKFLLKGYQHDGTPDPIFRSLELSDVAENLIIDGSDRVLYRSGIGPYLLQRRFATGELDTRFGTHGALTQPEFSAGISAVAIEEPGHILLGVAVNDEGAALYNRLKIVRYLDETPRPEPTPVPSATAEPAKPLALIYAVLDNNLGESWTRLVNNIEAGAADGMNVRLLIDGPGDNGDVYVYDMLHDEDPFCPSLLNITCNGRYVMGQNFWQFDTEDTANPSSLYQFIADANAAYPNATQLVVSLVGHGSGWSANVLPGQPRVWSDQNDSLGGMLWDDHPQAGASNSQSLSTLALGEALHWAVNNSGKKIDLLYLDGCSMGMVEVAYELRTSAKYLLSSPNLDWASFNYNALLPEVVTQNDGDSLGTRWLALEAAELRSNPGHPFTLALADLSTMETLAGNVSTLAQSLQSVIPDEKSAIFQSFNAAERFDSNFDGILDSDDSYVDLADFSIQLSNQLSTNGTIQQAAQTLQDSIDEVIIAKDSEGGIPWVYSDQTWQWENFGGLGVYLPLGVDEQRRQLFYNQTNLSWAGATEWDEFLSAFWADAVHSARNMPVCRATTDQCEGLANPLPEQEQEPTSGIQRLFLPVLKR
ncbi:MAG: clostripain-related cysteine peptidase [Chloroflexota bacterium]